MHLHYSGVETRRGSYSLRLSDLLRICNSHTLSLRRQNSKNAGKKG